MITYWLWSSVNKNHLDEIVIAILLTFFIMLPVDIVGFPLELVGYILYRIVRDDE